MRTRRTASGFTLIELMMVVAIVGIMSVLATYSVRKYIARAKTSEARASLGQLAKDAAAAYERESISGSMLAGRTSTGVVRRLCGTASASVPGSSAAIQGHKYQSKAAEWNADEATNAGFACLKFSIDQPQYYMYSYSIAGSGWNANDSFTAAAQGDLDGNGVLSLFQISGAINSKYVLNIAPNLLEVRPDE